MFGRTNSKIHKTTFSKGSQSARAGYSEREREYPTRPNLNYHPHLRRMLATNQDGYLGVFKEKTAALS